ncbi:MAG: hypothetical protein RL459_1727, partial [Pseudomonadota bacterium]
GVRSVTAHQLRLAWQPLKLLDRQLVVDQLSAEKLQLHLPTDDTPLQIPQDLQLPLLVDAHLRIDDLSWESSDTPDEATAPQASALVGHYGFDGTQHRLTLTQARLADGQYQGQIELGATAPLLLKASAQGELQTQVPGKGRPLTLTAAAVATGPLGGADPRLQVQASLQSQSGLATVAMQASLKAQWQPGAAQPLSQLEARFSGLNLAALWPQAPLTQVTGQVEVLSIQVLSVQGPANHPLTSTWQATGQMSNALPGPWDHQRLPLKTLQLDLTHDQGAWRINTLNASVDGGRIQVQGQLSTGTTGKVGTRGTRPRWEGRAEVQNLNPAALHSRLAPARLLGKLSAHTDDQGLAFQAQLNTATSAPSLSPVPGLGLRHLQAQGHWQAPWLRLSALTLSTSDASLSGTASIQTQALSGQADLKLHLPGTQATVQGDLAQQSGQGKARIQVTDAQASRRWLAALQGMPAALAPLSTHGQATLALGWAGGWRQWQTGTGSDLMLDAQLQTPQLTLQTSPEAPEWQAREVSVTLRGHPQTMDVQWQGRLHTGEQALRLNSRAQLSRLSAGNWQAQLAPTTVSWQSGRLTPPWTLSTQQPLVVRAGAQGRDFTVTAEGAQAQLAGPLPGSVTVQWQPMRWQHTPTQNLIRTDGRVIGIPLAWLESWGQSGVPATTLRGDLLADGAWHLELANTLKAQFSLERSRGDLRLQAGDKDAGLDAGIRVARLALNIEDTQAHARLDWDSLRAGQLQADVRTELKHDADGWHWPAQAPLAGQVQARLPQLGVWSVLAPPGWRVRGTLNSNITLSGTRAQPLWHGDLNADQLALRSVAEGIEFSNGELRASLNGQGMDILHFRLLGAGGEGGGELTATGRARWAAPPGATASDAGLKVTLDANARKLKVSARADRRLVVSGQMRVALTARQLQARGSLRADQALLMLPDEDTPALGADVVVRTTRPALGAPQPSASTRTNAAFETDIDLALDAGDDFQVRGRGLSTRLAGSVRLVRATKDSAPRLNGELRTVRGTYKAYGQQLDIEQGVLRFTGPYDNPGLDILALRPHLVVKVGVQVTGTVLSPRVRLYANPELPEADKLAWLVLGRGAASGGAEAAVLQQAAMALLGGAGRPLSGGLAEALGLDELSFRGATYGDTGTTTGATVTLGKRLSRDFYVAFERGLAGTVGTVYIFYNLSRRLTLRAQTGEQSAIDVILTVPYD